MNPSTRLMVAKLNDLAALGMTYVEAAAEVGAAYSCVASYVRRYKIPLRQLPRGRPCVNADARSLDMLELYKTGQTLIQIGEKYGITRERVRQILTKYHGTRREDGGQCEQARKKRKEFQRKREARAHKVWGCGYREYKRILKHEGKPTYAYWMQRRNAITRKIGWELNLWQWWKTWEQSGHWKDRGRGKGFCMCRLNDVGPYSVDNVYIATGSENMQDYWVNRHASELEAAA